MVVSDQEASWRFPIDGMRNKSGPQPVPKTVHPYSERNGGVNVRGLPLAVLVGALSSCFTNIGDMIFQVLFTVSSAVPTSTFPRYIYEYYHGQHVHYTEDYYGLYPKYKFEYSAHDPHTRDIKSQKEERDGDVVHGSYELVEADGSGRSSFYETTRQGCCRTANHRELR